MSDFLNLVPIPARLRALVGNRRHTQRFPVEREVRLIAGITLVDRKGEPQSFLGHTRNVSETGLSLILPYESVISSHVADQTKALVLIIALPTRTINLRGSTVYWKLLDEQKPEKGYLVGAQFTDLNTPDYEHLLIYLRTLR